jgi:hypothetical protein
LYVSYAQRKDTGKIKKNRILLSKTNKQKRIADGLVVGVAGRGEETVKMILKSKRKK